jgi:hypothetical protein
MTNSPDTEALREKAKQRVGLKLHLTIALGVNALMWVIYFSTGGGYVWPLWVLAGSVLGFTIHWLAVYSRFLSVEKEYQKLKK